MNTDRTDKLDFILGMLIIMALILGIVRALR